MTTGCVIFLLDESSAMNTPVAGGTKSKAESVATAVNALLRRLADGAECDVALIGYRSDAEGKVDVGIRFGKDLADRDVVPAAELADAPLAVQQRTRKVPGPAGTVQEEPVELSVWYEPTLGDRAPQIAAFEHCRQLLIDWAAGAGSTATAVPLIINVTAGPSGDGNPQQAIDGLMEMDLPAGRPIVAQAHLGSSATVPATLYPANRALLQPGLSRDLFDRASALPDSLTTVLKAAGLTINPQARALVYNAKMVELSQLFSIVPTHLAPPPPAPAEQEPPAAAVPAEQQQEAVAAETVDDGAAAAGGSCSVTPDAPALVAFVLDRSLENPFTGDLQNVCAKLQQHANDLLGEIARCGGGCIDTCLVSYGATAAWEVDVRSSFEGPLDGRQFVRDNELEAGAARVEESTEEISDGAGGLLKVPCKRPVFLEVEPTAPAPATPAFAELARLLSEWCSEHPTSGGPPIVLHLTRGWLDAGDLADAAAELGSVDAPAGDVVVYHLVMTERPHASLAYPDTDAMIEDPHLQTIWQRTSPLIDAARHAVDNPAMTPGARGLVINGKFDLLLTPIVRAMQ